MVYPEDISDSVLSFLEIVDSVTRTGNVIESVEVEQDEDGTLMGYCMTPDGSVLVAQEFPPYDREQLRVLLCAVVEMVSTVGQLDLQQVGV